MAWLIQVAYLYLRIIMIKLLHIAKQILKEGGNVFGTDAIGVVPTADPVFIAGIDENGDIATFVIENGKLKVISKQQKFSI